MTESPAVRARRLAHERQLERVGIGTPEGQALLERWRREARQMWRKARDDR